MAAAATTTTVSEEEIIQEVDSILPSHDLNCVCSTDGSYVFVKNIKDLYTKEAFGNLGIEHNLSLAQLTDGIYTYLVLSKKKVGKSLRMADKNNELYFMAIRVKSALELLTKHMVLATLLRDIHEDKDKGIVICDDKDLNDHVVIAGEMNVETIGDKKVYNYNLESGTFMVDRYDGTLGDPGLHPNSVWSALQRHTGDTEERKMQYRGRTPFITSGMCITRAELDSIARVGGEIYIIPQASLCKKVKTDSIYQGFINKCNDEIQTLTAKIPTLTGIDEKRAQGRISILQRQIDRAMKTFMLSSDERGLVETYRYVPTGGVGGKRKKRKTKRRIKLRKRITKKRVKKSLKKRFRKRK